MSNKTYNNIISLLSFLATLGFIICKIIDLEPVASKSWWFVVVPFLIAAVFHAESEYSELKEEMENDDDNDPTNNNLKMA